ncbi:heat shock 70 kDa protein 12A [Pelomyxa schiedti]|nr:heat shock 70 kDa protein 12A [Pelomyxa schiedti]
MCTAVVESSAVDRPVCCAIDLGSACSGYAFRDARNRSGQIVFAEWPETVSGQQKVPTEVVLNATEPHEAIKFGREARVFMQNLDPTQVEEVYYFRNFRILIYGTSATREIECVNKPEVHLPLELVISRVLKYIVGMALGHMNREFITTVANVKWILTVPAIWDQGAKSFMVRCASNAGLQDVTLALEPEAASVAIKHSLGLEVGSTYIIVDAGGGTVDIGVHKCETETELVELYPPSGGAWGSTYVNETVIGFLQQVFGSDVLERAKADLNWLELEDEIESAKLSVNALTTRINASASCIYDALKAMGKPKLASLISDFNSPLIQSYQASRLRLDASVFTNKIVEQATRASDHILNNIIPNLGDVRVGAIYLVGGLSRCEVFRRIMTTALQTPERKVCNPNFPLSSVLEGAVIFGEHPLCITKRRMTDTHGEISTMDSLTILFQEMSKRRPVGGFPGVKKVESTYQAVCANFPQLKKTLQFREGTTQFAAWIQRETSELEERIRHHEKQVEADIEFAERSCSEVIAESKKKLNEIAEIFELLKAEPTDLISLEMKSANEGHESFCKKVDSMQQKYVTEYQSSKDYKELECKLQGKYEEFEILTSRPDMNLQQITSSFRSDLHSLHEQLNKLRHSASKARVTAADQWMTKFTETLLLCGKAMNAHKSMEKVIGWIQHWTQYFQKGTDYDNTLTGIQSLINKRDCFTAEKSGKDVERKQLQSSLYTLHQEFSKGGCPQLSAQLRKRADVMENSWNEMTKSEVRYATLLHNEEKRQRQNQENQQIFLKETNAFLSWFTSSSKKLASSSSNNIQEAVKVLEVEYRKRHPTYQRLSLQKQELESQNYHDMLGITLKLEEVNSSLAAMGNTLRLLGRTVNFKAWAEKEPLELEKRLSDCTQKSYETGIEKVTSSCAEVLDMSVDKLKFSTAPMPAEILSTSVLCREIEAARQEQSRLQKRVEAIKLTSKATSLQSHVANLKLESDPTVNYLTAIVSNFQNSCELEAWVCKEMKFFKIPPKFDNTLRSAQEVHWKHTIYLATKRHKQTQKEKIADLERDITQAQSQLHRQPPLHCSKQIESTWLKMEILEYSYFQVISAELEKQTTPDRIQKEFFTTARALLDWANKGQRCLSSLTANIVTLQEAKAQEAVLLQVVKDWENENHNKWKSVKSQFALLKEAQFSDIDRAQDLFREVKKLLDDLHTLKTEKGHLVSKSLNRGIANDNFHNYMAKAMAFSLWAQGQIERIGDPSINFGNSVEAVESKLKQISSDDEITTKTMTQKLEEMQSVLRNIKKVYSPNTIVGLCKQNTDAMMLQEQVRSAIKTRKNTGTAELQKANKSRASGSIAAYEVIIQAKEFFNSTLTNFALDVLPSVRKDPRQQAILCKNMWDKCVELVKERNDTKPAHAQTNEELGICVEQSLNLPACRTTCIAIVQIYLLCSSCEFSYPMPGEQFNRDFMQVFPTQRPFPGRVEFCVIPRFAHQKAFVFLAQS